MCKLRHNLSEWDIPGSLFFSKDELRAVNFSWNLDVNWALNEAEMNGGIYVISFGKLWRREFEHKLVVIFEWISDHAICFSSNGLTFRFFWHFLNNDHKMSVVVGFDLDEKPMIVLHLMNILIADGR